MDAPVTPRTPEVKNDSGHFVSLSAKNLALGGCIVGAITVLQPVKEWLFTREEGNAVIQRVVVVENTVKDLSTEIKSLSKAVEDNNKELRQAIDEKNEKLRVELKEEIRLSQSQILARIEETTNRVINSMDRRDSVLNEKIKDLKLKPK